MQNIITQLIGEAKEQYLSCRTIQPPLKSFCDTMCYMDYVSFRIDKPLRKAMEKDMSEFHYATTSDYLREAIREKHQKIDEERKKEAAWEKILSMRGKLKGKATTDEEYRKIREKTGEEFIKELAKRFNYEIPNQKQTLQAKAP